MNDLCFKDLQINSNDPVKSFLYETHLHTSPVSKCASASVKDSLEFYKSIGYDGVFITNHFLDGNNNIDSKKSYKEKINFYFYDYEKRTRKQVCSSRS